MTKNNIGQATTDTPIVMALIAFNVFLLFAVGFIDMNNFSPSPSTGDYEYQTNISVNTSSYSVPITNFKFANIVTNISEFGGFNILLFAPIIGAIIYIVAKLIRGN